MKRKLLLLLILFTCTLLSLQAETNRADYKAPYLLEITVEPGIGGYIGNFGSYLFKKKAYFFTPALDLYLSFNIFNFFGLQLMLGSGCVIHPNSEPIEGTIVYMAIEPYFKVEIDEFMIKFFSGIGFEHTTMLIQYYSSAFCEAGLTAAYELNPRIYLTNSLKFRTGFLHSILLPPERPLMSLTFSMGLLFRTI